MISRFLAAVLIAPIRLYQRYVSPMRPPTCRFYPSCSAYAVKAISIHGPFLGSWLAIKRLFRCHPWTPGGVDDVPPKGRVREFPPPYDPTEETGAATRSAAPVEHASSLIPSARSISTRAPFVTPDIAIQGA